MEEALNPSSVEGTQDVPFSLAEDGKKLQNDIKIDFPNMEELTKSIKKLTTAINESDEPDIDDSMYIGGNKGKKYLSDNKNRKLTDLEIFEKSLNQIKEYENATGEQAPIPPKFVAYMEDFVKTVGGGAMTTPEYKRSTIFREMNLANIKNLK